MRYTNYIHKNSGRSLPTPVYYLLHLRGNLHEKGLNLKHKDQQAARGKHPVEKGMMMIFTYAEELRTKSLNRNAWKFTVSKIFIRARKRSISENRGIKQRRCNNKSWQGKSENVNSNEAEKTALMSTPIRTIEYLLTGMFQYKTVNLSDNEWKAFFRA